MEINKIDDIFYSLVILTTINGTNCPRIWIHDYGPNRLIECFGTTDLIESKNVKKFIDDLKEKIKVNGGNSKFYLYHDDLNIEFLGPNVRLFQDSADPMECIISLKGLQQLLSHWYDFLKIYENGDIPGVKKNYFWKQ